KQERPNTDPKSRREPTPGSPDSKEMSQWRSLSKTAGSVLKPRCPPRSGSSRSSTHDQAEALNHVRDGVDHRGTRSFRTHRPDRGDGHNSGSDRHQRLRLSSQRTGRTTACSAINAVDEGRQEDRRLLLAESEGSQP